MALLDYDNARQVYQDNEDMLETINRMEKFDEFHLLRNGNMVISDQLKMKFSHIPSAVLLWYRVCNGGLLFASTLLSMDNYDNELDLDFASFDENNKEENYKTLGLPEGYYIIGLRSYGDPICVSKDNDKVYLWNVEEQDFDTIWDSFNDFLGDETDASIEMISDGSLEPIPYKLDNTD